MKICYYLCGVASALLLALPLHSATELGKLPLTTPMDTSAEVTQKIKDSSLKINGYDVDGSELVVTNGIVFGPFVDQDCETLYIMSSQYADEPDLLVFTKTTDNVTDGCKPLYYYGTRQPYEYYGQCHVSTNIHSTIVYCRGVVDIDPNTGTNIYGWLTAPRNARLMDKPHPMLLSIDTNIIATVSSGRLATGNNGIIIGNRAYINSDTHEDCIVIGNYAGSRAIRSISLGPDSSSLGAFSVAIGSHSVSTGDFAIAIGTSVESAANSVAIGEVTKAKAPLTVSVGSYSKSTGEGSISIGADSQAYGYTSVSIGKSSAANADWGISIGNQSKADASSTISVGNQSIATNHMAIAIGERSDSGGTGSIALGFRSNAKHDNSISIGTGATATNANAIAIGTEASVMNKGSISIGAQSIANHTNATSVGSGVTSHGEGTFNIYPDTMDKVYLKDNKLSDLVNTAITNQIADVVPSMIPPEKPEPTALLTNAVYIRIGKNAKSAGGYGVAIGNNACLRGRGSIAIGNNATVTNCNPFLRVGGIAIGQEAIASNNYATAIGYGALATDTNSTVIAVGTNTVNSHGINTFTVGLTDNDPLNYFYLGSSSLKSLLDGNYANATQLDSVKGATNITTYVYGEGDDTVYELSLGGVGMIATRPSSDQAQAKFLTVELNSIVSDASYNNQSNAIAFCSKGVFDSPSGPDFSKVSTLFVDGSRVATEKHSDGRYATKTDFNNFASNALMSTNDINLADGKSINLAGNFTMRLSEETQIYGPELSAGWDNSEYRMTMKLKGPSTPLYPIGVILESGDYSGDGGKITVQGGASMDSGGKLYVEATDAGSGAGQIYIRGVNDSYSGYDTPHITMIGGYVDLMENPSDAYHYPEITVGEVKVRESITNLNNSAITKIANQSVTGGNVNLGEGLEFVGNNPLSQFDHKYYITVTGTDDSYTAFTKASDEYNSSGAGYPLYNEDGSRLSGGSFYINKYKDGSWDIVYIRTNSLELVVGETATFTELPFVKQSNVISVSTNIAFKSDIEAVKTHLGQVESDLQTFKSELPVYSNEYGQVRVNLNEDTVGLKIAGQDCSIALKTRDHNYDRSATLELNGGDLGGSRINVNAGINHSGSIYVGAATVSVSAPMTPATITIDSAFTDEKVVMKGGSMNPDTGSINPADITIGDCQVRKSIDKLTTDVTQVANNLTNSQNVVIGKNARINDDEYSAVAIGRAARVNGMTYDSSIAIGDGSLCESGSARNCNIAIGSGATASNYNSVAIGYGATASHANSISIGANAKSHGENSFNITIGAIEGNGQFSGLHSVYINDNNLVTLFDKRMDAINEAWILKDPNGNTRLLTPNYNTIYQYKYDDASARYDIIEFLDGYNDGYKFTWNSYTGGMILKLADSSNVLTSSVRPGATIITFTDSNNRNYTVTRKKSYERQTYFNDKINSLITKIQQMETTISNLTQQVNALQNP